MKSRIYVHHSRYELTVSLKSLYLRQLMAFRVRGAVIVSVAYVWQWRLGRGTELKSPA